MSVGLATNSSSNNGLWERGLGLFKHFTASQGIVLICGIAVVCIGLLFAGQFPLSMSIGILFAFAGLHNLFELRYFLARLPVRPGGLKNYFSLAVLGTFFLGITYSGISVIDFGFSAQMYRAVLVFWNLCFTAWIFTMLVMVFRRREIKSSRWPILALAIVFLLSAYLAASLPVHFIILLINGHNLVGLFILQAEIRRLRPDLLVVYRLILGAVFLGLIVLGCALYSSMDLPIDSHFNEDIIAGAGGFLFGGISSHMLVSTLVYLQFLHYVVWLLAMPLLTLSGDKWQFRRIPVANLGISGLIKTTFLVGILATVMLWLGFCVDFTLTRKIYFALAIFHVLAEFPFLFRWSLR